MSGYNSQMTYQENMVLSTSPERLVPLLYDHLLINIKRGSMFIRKGDIERKYESLRKASDIVSELLSTLDFDAGGELATRLASLYGFWGKEISIAGRLLDGARLDRVAEMVASLREAWAEAARIVESGEGAASPEGPA